MPHLRNMENKEQHIEKITHVQTWQGSLPPPETIEKYDKIVPGAAERILSMAESEMKHRHKSEDKLLKDRTRLSILSTIFAFLCVILLGVVLCFAIYIGSDTAAIASAIGAIAAVVGLFTYGKAKHKD